MEDIESAREESIKKDSTWRDAKISDDTEKHSVKGVSTDDKIEPIVESRRAKDNIVVISFQKLQLQRIAEIQDELLKLTLLGHDDASLKDDEKHTEKVDRLLDKYSHALRNYETLSLNPVDELLPKTKLIGQLSASSLVPPRMTSVGKVWFRFFSSTREAFLKGFFQTYTGSMNSVLELLDEKQPRTLGVRFSIFHFFLRILVYALGGRVFLQEPTERIEIVATSQGFRELDKKGQQERAQKSALFERMVMAIFGGLALIGPMLIMTLHPSKNTSLITTSVAVFIFAFLLANGASDSSGKDILAATAAYAAVLVVFVGTSSAPVG